MESIQPKQIASSTASGYGQTGRPVRVRHEHSQTPRSASWLVSSQARHWARVSAWKIGRSNFHVAGCSDADRSASAIPRADGRPVDLRAQPQSPPSHQIWAIWWRPPK